MSRVPNPGYGYPVPAAFYYDTELQDFQETEIDPLHQDATYWSSVPRVEALPNATVGDVSELYRRKAQEQTARYVLTPPPSTEYYYPVPPGGYIRRRIPVLTERPISQIPVQVRPVSPAPYYPPADEPIPIRTTHHPHTQWTQEIIYRPSTPPPLMRPAANLVRRPVTADQKSMTSPRQRNKPIISVRTPRYYRRHGGPLYRRMSTLCLPLASQPDPAQRHIKSMRQQMVNNSAIQQMMAQQYRKRRKQIEEEQIKHSKQQNNHNLQIHSDSENTAVPENIIRCEDVEDDESDVPSRKCPADIKTILNHYQQSFDRGDHTHQQHSDEARSIRSNRTNSRRSKCSITLDRKRTRTKHHIPTHLLKPKLPPSLLEKKKSVKRRTEGPNSDTSIEAGKIQMEPLTTEALDKMLTQLAKMSVNDKKNEKFPPTKLGKKSRSLKSGKSFKSNGSSSKGSSKDVIEKEIPKEVDHQDIPTSLNYAELSNFIDNDNSCENISEVNPRTEPNDFSQPEKNVELGPNPNQDVFDQSQQIYQEKFSDQEHEKYCHDPEEVQFNKAFMMNVKKKSPWTDTKLSAGDHLEARYIQQRLQHYHTDDNSAIEIHQSKSYIVNLIDRALSREFRTMPEDRGNKIFHIPANFQSPRHAPPHINPLKYQNKLDEDLCLEIKQAMEECQRTQGPPTGSDISKESCCSKDSQPTASNTGQEIFCLNQLKKLRYGRLKHLQREMQKLEDLERFIDSYSGTEVSP